MTIQLWLKDLNIFVIKSLDMNKMLRKSTRNRKKECKFLRFE